MDTNSITIEMRSMYVGAANSPANLGVLFEFTIDSPFSDITISENAGRCGVVMENPEEQINVIMTGCETSYPEPTCWNVTECAGQPNGDANCDGNVNLSDLIGLRFALLQSDPWLGNTCCADFNHDGKIDLADLFILKVHFGSSGYTPSTGNQNCP